ncbi:hypothetical protein, partial [Thiohalocapsa sp.]|uniref:hypothetical protein n=1 Tax=Thiohalocapsa sp. TaxID=2497641 RepID=UPI0025F3CCBD
MQDLQAQADARAAQQLAEDLHQKGKLLCGAGGDRRRGQRQCRQGPAGIHDAPEAGERTFIGGSRQRGLKPGHPRAAAAAHLPPRRENRASIRQLRPGPQGRGG